ncbi:MAG: S-layer homology domain-containing protein [Clostridiales bacterium]|nr:S-layer homology domain-containing protein [Clostridiales bacterium]
MKKSTKKKTATSQLTLCKASILSIALILTLALGTLPTSSLEVLAAADVAINADNFPDPVFREHASDPKIDKNQDGVLSVDEIAAVTELYVYNTGITDLKGIGFFTALKELYCGNIELKALDVSKNANLKILVCDGNRLTELDVSKNVNLEMLVCDGNRLTELDVSKNANLKLLSCDRNQLAELDVSKNIKLEVLSCAGNQLSRLPFSDVREGDWYFGDVLYVYNNELITSDTSYFSFSPNKQATRGVLVAALYAGAGSPVVASGGSPFNDVPDDAFYAEAVAWAVKNGIVNGFGDGTFGPEKNITRQDLAVILLRYETSVGIDLPNVRAAQQFSDSSSIAGYAKDAAGKLFAQGIVNGKPGNLFDPGGTTTRAEVAAVLHRFLEPDELVNLTILTVKK